jgi:hypothetical protein
VTLDVGQLALLGLLSTALHWLIARSKIAQPLWSRARGWAAALLACPACSGWWLGLGLGTGGVRPVMGSWRIVEVIASGLLAVVLTPIFEGVMLWGLERSAIEQEEPDEPVS